MSLSGNRGQISVRFSHCFRLSFGPRGISRAGWWTGGGQGLGVFSFSFSFFFLGPYRLAGVAAERTALQAEEPTTTQQDID